jgi:hypothetical protein
MAVAGSSELHHRRIPCDCTAIACENERVSDARAAVHSPWLCSVSDRFASIALGRALDVIELAELSLLAFETRMTSPIAATSVPRGTSRARDYINGPSAACSLQSYHEQQGPTITLPSFLVDFSSEAL